MHIKKINISLLLLIYCFSISYAVVQELPDSIETEAVKITESGSNNNFTYTDSDGNLIVDGSFSDYYNLWLQYYSNGSGSGYPAKMFLIDTLSNYDMDVAEDQTGPHFCIVQRKSRYFYAGNYFSQFRIGSFNRTQKSGKDSIANSNMGLEACFSSYDRSLMGINDIIYINDSTGQTIINDKTFHFGSDTYPCLIKGSLAVQDLYSDNKFIYANSVGKLCTTYVKFYGDATIFPGAIWCDSTHTGIGISNLGSGPRTTYIAGGASWSSEHGSYLQLNGNGDEDSTGSVTLKAGIKGNVNLSGDSIIIHLYDPSDDLADIKYDLLITHGIIGYDDSNTVFIRAYRNSGENSVIRILGGKGSSTTGGMIELGNEESNHTSLWADTISLNGIVLLSDAVPAVSADTILIKNNGRVRPLLVSDLLASLSGTASASFDWNSQELDNVGRIGINTTADPNRYINIDDAALSFTSTFYGIYQNLVKTAGASDVNDHFYGNYNLIDLNQNAGTIGYVRSTYNLLRVTDGNIGDVSNSRTAINNLSFLDLNGGKIWGDAIVGFFSIDQEAANEITGDVYGIQIYVDLDGTVGGTSYMLYLNEASGIDYGIYQNGTAPNVFGGDLQCSYTTANRMAWIGGDKEIKSVLSSIDTTEIAALDSVLLTSTPYCSLFDGATYRARAQAFVRKSLKRISIQLPQLTGAITASTITTIHFPAGYLVAPVSSLSFYPLHPIPINSIPDGMGWIKDSTNTVLRVYGSIPYGYMGEDASGGIYPCQVDWFY